MQVLRLRDHAVKYLDEDEIEMHLLPIIGLIEV
jgi:hypothetical protein